MRAIITPTVSFFLLIASCENNVQQRCPDNILTTRIMTEIPMKGEQEITVVDGSKDALVELFFQNVITKALRGQIQCIDPLTTPWDKSASALPSDKVRAHVYRVDTMLIEMPKPPHELVRVMETDSFRLNHAYSIRPYEEWRINSLKIAKKVMGYDLTREFIDPASGLVRGVAPILTTKSTDMDGKPSKLVRVRYVQPINYAVAIADPQSYLIQNLEMSVRAQFFGELLSQAEKGTLTVYSGPMESLRLSREFLQHLLVRSDTVHIERAEPPYDLFSEVVTTPMGVFDIVAIEFIQDIYMDDHGNMGIDVKWYGPVTGNTDKYGTLHNTKTLFWVKN